MKTVFTVIFFLFSLSAFCGGALKIKGQVKKIENSIVYLISDEEEIKIPVKKLSQSQKQKVNESIATKKVITLEVSPLVLQ